MGVKTKNSAWVLFAAVSFGIGILLACNTHSRSVNAAKPAGEAQPLFTPVTASLAQQKMCDEQAAKKFRENGHGALDTYTSHYDPTVNVCYIRVHSLAGNPPLVTDVVYDAFGGRVYANYLWVNPQNKKYWGCLRLHVKFTFPVSLMRHARRMRSLMS
jgi:hypothetical protein